MKVLFSIIVCVLALCGAPARAGNAPDSIVILLFDGVDIIDFAAPYDVFVNAGMRVFTVTRDGKPVTTGGGMKVTPDYAYADAPGAQALVIPGGDTGKVQKDAATIEWIRQRHGQGGYLLSVCNGAFTVANTGLMKGMKVTTTSGNIDALRRAHADLTVVRDARVIDNGRIIATGGLSAGIDGALYLVARLQGQGKARFVAEVLEYDWQPEGRFLPALHAFHIMHQTVADENLTGIGHIETLASTAGDADQWSYVWHVRSAATSAALADHIDAALAQERLEMKMNPPYAASPGHRWTFADSDGQTWHERLEVTPVAGESGLHAVRLAVSKAAPAH